LSAPSVQTQQLADARNAFWNVHNYQSTRDTYEMSQGLLATVDTLIGAFYGEARAISLPLSGPEVDVAATEVRNNVDSYLLDIRERIKQLESRIGDQNLSYAHDVLKQSLHNEIERLRKDARAAL
jgi:hypothetical protein